jgi:hypothetical protein
MSTLTIAPVYHRRVVDGGQYISVFLHRQTPVEELPDELLQAVREAEAEEASAQARLREWTEEAQSLRTLVRRLQWALDRLQGTLQYGPLWAAAAAAFAAERVRTDLESALKSLSHAEERLREAEQALKGARRSAREARTRADESRQMRWTSGPRVTVRFRRDGNRLVPVHADRPDAVPVAAEAARAWLESRSRRAEPRWLREWAAEQALRRAAEAEAQVERPSETDDEFDSFGPDWEWQEELRRREAADQVLSRSCGLDALRAPTLILLQRDNALEGRAWELASAWLREIIPQLVARGVRDFRIPGTKRGRHAAELIRQLGGCPLVFAVPEGTDDELEAAYKAALQTAGGLVLVAGSAHEGGTPLYLLDPALAAASEVAPLVALRWRDGQATWVAEPAIEVPWVRFDLARALNGG